MMVIQIIIIVVALGILFFGLRNSQTHSSRAWKKIALLVLVVAMIVAVIFPGETTLVAHLVGVGRGADLLLYLLTLVFIGYVINNYLNKQREKETLYKLARRVALLDAHERYGKRQKL